MSAFTRFLSSYDYDNCSSLTIMTIIQFMRLDTVTKTVEIRQEKYPLPQVLLRVYRINLNLNQNSKRFGVWELMYKSPNQHINIDVIAFQNFSNKCIILATYMNQHQVSSSHLNQSLGLPLPSQHQPRGSWQSEHHSKRVQVSIDG